MNCPIKNVQVIQCNGSYILRIALLYEDDVVYAQWKPDQQFCKELTKSSKSMILQKQCKVYDIDENIFLQHDCGSFDIERVVLPLDKKYKNIKTGEIIDKLEVFVPVFEREDTSDGTFIKYVEDPRTIMYRILDAAYKPLTATAHRG